MTVLAAAVVLGVGVGAGAALPQAVETPTLYARHCAVCHGATGRGDGPAAGLLTPPPRDLHPQRNDGLVVVAERTFQALLLRVPPDVAGHYRRWPTH